MRNVVTVRPQGPAWVLEADLPGYPLTFLSGAQAEEAAILQAEHQASGGAFTEVRLFLRDGSLAGRFLVCANDRRLPLSAELAAAEA